MLSSVDAIANSGVSAGLFAASLFLAISALAGTAKPSDDEVRQVVIQESIASYPGIALAPYNLASNGSRCSKRSAWSRAGGYAPICYPGEVTPTMIQQWRKAHSGS